MELLLRLFEDCIRDLRENRTTSLQNAYENDTLAPRIKAIIRGIEALAKGPNGNGNGGVDAFFLTVALSKFRDDLSIGTEDCGREISMNQALPEAFREAVREIALLIEKKDEQLNSLLEDTFFYKDIFNIILGDKSMSEDELNMRDNIAQDKRKKAWMLLQKVEELRRGREKKEVEQKSAIKSQMAALEKKVEVLEAQHEEDKRKIEEAEKKKSAEFAHKEADLRDAIGALKRLKAQSQKWQEEGASLREELGEVKKQNQMLQQSLSSNMMESGRFLAEKQSAVEAIKDKDTIIQELRKSLNEQSLELEKAKKASIEEEGAKSKNSQQKLNEAQSKVSHMEKKYETTLKMLAKEKERNAEKDSRIKQLEEQASRKQSQHSMNQQADTELVRRARSFLQSAQQFSQIYQSQRNHSSILSESFALNSSRERENPRLSRSVSKKQEMIELSPFLRKIMEPDAVAKVVNELPKWPFAEVVYRFPEDKAVSFKERLRGRSNLLLVCKAEVRVVFGSFSSSGFINASDHKDSSAFLFCANQQTSALLLAKQGKCGVVQDEDFLIFGNEELCLQQGCNYATSYFQPSNLSSLCFEGTLDQRYQFLQLLDCHPPSNRIPLSRYDILELIPQ